MGGGGLRTHVCALGPLSCSRALPAPGLCRLSKALPYHIAGLSPNPQNLQGGHQQAQSPWAGQGLTALSLARM